MKFAMLEMKLTLAKLLIKFNVEPGQSTPSPEEYMNGFSESLLSARRHQDHLKVVFNRR
jgi:hypothetical protein